VDRIVQAAQLLRSRGATRLRLRLNPPSLGDLKVDLTVRKGVLEGRLTAESQQARDQLAAHMERLKEQLAAQGLNVGEFQVGVDQSFRQAHGDPSTSKGSLGRGPSGENGELPAEEPADGRSARLQIIDVRI
jgi:flagellar hook-length control protein FliK